MKRQQRPDGSDKTVVELLVAKYGMFGVIISSIIGVVGMIAAAYIGNMNSRNQPPEARIAQNSLPSPVASDAPAVQASPSNGTAAPAGPPSSFPASLEVEETWGVICGLWNVIPNNIDPAAMGEDPAIMERAAGWQMGPDPGLYLLLSNTGETFMEVGSELTVTVAFHEPEQPSADVIADSKPCSVSEIREFSNVELASGFASYTTSSTFPADFFKLAPGEYEYFDVPFKCKGPGVYTVKVELPYRIKDEKGVIALASPSTVVCPEKYTVWENYSTDFNKVMFGAGKNYSWDPGSGGYIEEK